MVRRKFYVFNKAPKEVAVMYEGPEEENTVKYVLAQLALGTSTQQSHLAWMRFHNAIEQFGGAANVGELFRRIYWRFRNVILSSAFVPQTPDPVSLLNALPCGAKNMRKHNC